MTGKPEYIHNLIIDYLSGGLNDADEAILFQWITKSEQNKIEFEQTKGIWNNDESFIKPAKLNWEQLSTIINDRDKKHYKFEKQWIAIAATMILLVATGWFLNSLTKSNDTLQTSTNSYITDTLENGCVVYLYPSSELISTSNYLSQNKQEYDLEGEAFFVIPKDTDKEVIITVGDAQIKVEGTSFRVSSCNNGNSISVMVESGLVKLTKKSDPMHQLMINAGEQGYYSCSNHKMWKQEKSESIYLIYQPENVNTN